MHRLLLFSFCNLNALEQASQKGAFTQPPSTLNTICITTAANVEKRRDWQVEEIDLFRHFGLKLEPHDIAGKTPQQTADILKDADVIYVTGGNTFYLLEHMQKTDFARPLQQRLDAGALYIGTSAGAVVTCPDISFVADMDAPEKANLTDTTGLNLVSFNIVPHVGAPGQSNPAQNVMQQQQHASTPLLGLREEQAAYIQGSYVEVFG